MIDTTQLQDMDAAQLRALAMELMSEVRARDSELRFKDARIAQLTHEMAVLKRWKFAARSEKLGAEQQSLLDEAIDADLVAIEQEIEQLAAQSKADAIPNKPRRMPLPANLPRIEVRHEPESTTCGCGCQLRRIGEDVSEKLDYTPGVFTVERHVRGKWVCARCETLIQAPVPAQVIDKGIPTAGLLAQVLVAKYGDHLPLYRQEGIFGRAGLAIPRSTLAQWVGMCGVQLQPLVDALKEQMLRHRVMHADETPVAMLSPGKGKTQRAYLWTYCPGAFEDLKAVVYDFADSRAGEHARDFLRDWRGQLVCDDFTGYKALFAQGVTELGCMAHARRKFYDLHTASKSEIARDALQYIGQLYEIEREVQQLAPNERLDIRQQRARPIAEALHAWMTQQRVRVSEGSAIAKALDYSLRRWVALTRYLDDPQVPIDNNWCENQIRPIAIGRNNWLFAGSLRAGRRAAAAMSLIQSAKLNGHDPYAYLKDVLTRLPTQPASRLEELLPHRWQPSLQA
ncbi:IS66 family transposase [Paraburkholderia nemoris]|jgi:transposase|uniref:IS66 family transposase n=1 Tax=Paraburkholderia nemoris TaxID=2793076 RepID=UPI0006B667AA|nr:IS66 family transposase [Paraburkholderia nemoris]KPD14512.1 transposase [Burkholderia sp. ST111]MBK3746056.1 IS66 family transposase [Paraburkholderia aspalathi]CAE6859468.1 IS66 family transposase ISPpu19 [Paraburkholderia nemoris]CAE6862168.1 IS66 family transposase ISPpu19 [Paraburkholderia nemoris]